MVTSLLRRRGVGVVRRVRGVLLATVGRVTALEGENRMLTLRTFHDCVCWVIKNVVMRTAKTNLLLAPVLGSRLALAIAVGVVLGRLLAVATASALLALVVVVLRGHVVCVCHFGRIRFQYDTVNKNRFEMFRESEVERKMMSREQVIVGLAALSVITYSGRAPKWEDSDDE